MAANLEQPSCPLSDPSLGIISENDHKVGLCICQFCTCEQHHCPFQQTRAYLPLASIYKVDFAPKDFDSPLRHKKPEYVPNPHKMDLKTVTGSDFVRYEDVQSPKRERKTTRKSMEMVSNTNYRRQFINWGKYPVYRAKQWHPSYKQKELPFLGESMYQQSFKLGKGERSRPAGSSIKNNIKIGYESLEDKSTYARTMRAVPPDARVGSAKLTNRDNELFGRSNSPNHFNTTANQFFKFASPSIKDPRQVRLSLFSRN